MTPEQQAAYDLFMHTNVVEVQAKLMSGAGGLAFIGVLIGLLLIGRLHARATV